MAVAPTSAVTPPAVGSLDRLTSLRAFAALGVFVYHASLLWGQHRLTDNAYDGVSFFFVLSGFILVWSAPAVDTALRFYRRRFARIYPAHLVMLVVALVVPAAAGSRGVGAILSSVTLTQAWGRPQWQWLHGVNSVSWTLSCEAFFYALFPLALVLSRRLSTRSIWQLALGLLAAEVAVVVVGVLSNFAVVPGSNPLIRFPEFALGLAAGIAVQRGWRPAWSLTQAAVGVAVVYLVLSLTDAAQPLADVALAIPFCLLIAAAAAGDLSGTRSWLTNRWMIYAGQISFCFYLVHFTVMLNFADATGIDVTNDGSGRGLLAVIAVLVLATAAAAALHHGVELPMQRRLRGPQLRRPVGSEAPAP